MVLFWRLKLQKIWPWEKGSPLGEVYANQAFPLLALTSSHGGRRQLNWKRAAFGAEEQKVGFGASTSSWKFERKESQKGGCLRRGVPKSGDRLPSNPQLTPGQRRGRVRCRSPGKSNSWKANLRLLYAVRWSLEFNSCPVRGHGKHLQLSTETGGHTLGVRITSQD